MELKHEIARRGADAVIEDKILSGNQDQEDDEVWRRGDLASVEGDLEKMKAESPELYEKVLPDRNRHWLRKLQSPLQGKKNLMVLIGVAHLGGSEGLLQLLRQSGFRVEQLYGVDRPVPPLRSQSGPRRKGTGTLLHSTPQPR
jgi:pheromone shutdown protein TraB